MCMIRNVIVGTFKLNAVGALVRAQRQVVNSSIPWKAEVTEVTGIP